MKYVTHDENGYPLNYNPLTFYQAPEVFIEMPFHVNYMFNNLDTARYMISNYGRVYDKITGIYHPKNLQLGYNDYNKIMLKDINGNNMMIKTHRLICAVYYGIIGIYTIKHRPVVNHKDGVKWHNEPYNLEWVDQRGNYADALNSGLISRVYGEENTNAKLSDNQYHQICKYIQDGLKPHEINKIMNLGFDITNIVQKIRNGVSVKYISEQYDFSDIQRNNYSKFSDNDVIKICKFLESGTVDEDEIIKNILGKDVKDLSRELRYLCRKRIRDIKNRKSFSEISKEFKF